MAQSNSMRSQINLEILSPNDYSESQESISRGLQRLIQLAQKRRAWAGKTKHSRYGDDYAAFIEKELGVSLWAKQRAIVEAVRSHRRVAVRAAFGVGKTHVGAALAVAYYECHLGSQVITTATKMAQVRHQMWAKIRRLDKSGLPPLVTMKVDPDDPTHLMLGQTSATPEAFRGMHAENLLIIIDEASGCERMMWEASENMAVAEKNRILAIGNPTRLAGPFADAFKSENWHTLEISALEHPNILAGLRNEPEPYPGGVSLTWLQERLDNPDYCECLGAAADDTERAGWLNDGAFQFPYETGDWYMPTSRGQVDILGIFPTMTEDSPWNSDWLKAARTRQLPLPENGLLEIGLDPAGPGRDKTALHARIGPCSVFHDTWHLSDTTETIGRTVRIVGGLKLEFAAPHVHIRVDYGGLGIPIFDALHERLAGDETVTLEKVISSDKASNPERYPNRRSELWLAAASRGRSGDLDLSRLDQDAYDLLFRQLLEPKYKMDSHGRDEMEPKSDTKKRIGRSPDDADAFNLAYAGTARAEVNWGDALHERSRWAGRTVEGTGEGWGAGRIRRDL